MKHSADDYLQWLDNFMSSISEVCPPFVQVEDKKLSICTQSITFMLAQQLARADPNMGEELKALAHSFDLYQHKVHPKYSQLLSLLTEYLK